METIVRYDSEKGRSECISVWENKHFRMLYDTLYLSEAGGGPAYGELTFTDDVQAPAPESIVAQKRESARKQAIDAITANKGAAPWGAILYTLAVAQGLIEPE